MYLYTIAFFSAASAFPVFVVYGVVPGIIATVGEVFFFTAIHVSVITWRFNGGRFPSRRLLADGPSRVVFPGSWLSIPGWINIAAMAWIGAIKLHDQLDPF